MTFEFATAARIRFGPGSAREVGALAAGLGRRALLVHGATASRADAAATDLAARGLEVTRCAVAAEPSTTLVEEAARLARAAGCDVVVGLGGGSVLDAAKAIAALLTNPGDLFDFLEVVGRGRPLAAAPAPVVAVPTTAGTGSEVTRNAVLLSPQHRVKVSLRSPLMLPAVAVVDPELTRGLPPAVTAATGLDALTQCLEPFVSPHANPLTDGFCREGMRRAARSLRRACAPGDDAAAREDMSLASLCGGLALANAKLGAIHGFAAPLGGRFPAPHGAVCARLLPFVMEANVAALAARDPASPALARYDEAARLLTGRPDARAADGVAWARDLCADLAVPPFRRYGVAEADVPGLVAAARRASSMQGNPVELTDEELARVLRQAMGD